MFLAVNIGNTNTRFGLFNGQKLTKTLIIPTRKTDNVKTEILRFTQNNIPKKTIIASVVPSKNKKFAFLNPVFIHEIINLGEVGADIYCGITAACKLYGGPGLVIDLGTATTFNAYDKNGKLLGVSIAPGLQTSHKALIEKTALLQEVELKTPPSVIGTNTISAIQGGVVLGHVSMIEGMVKRFKDELGDIKTTATGGLSELISKNTNVFDNVEPNLVLKGIQIIESA